MDVGAWPYLHMNDIVLYARCSQGQFNLMSLCIIVRALPLPLALNQPLFRYQAARETILAMQTHYNNMLHKWIIQMHNSISTHVNVVW